MDKVMEGPWNEWIPGVLNRDQMKQLCDEELITVEGSPEKALDESSIDLSVSDEAFRMRQGSVKPRGSHRPYSWFLKKKELAERLSPSSDETYLLRVRETYVFKLREKLARGLADARIYGQATAKSSVGRVDVLSRLIVNGMDTYEQFDPEGLERQSGDMYLEITPITFNVKVKPGKPLSQLRLFKGDPKDVEIASKELFKTILDGPGAKDGSLTVDLTDAKIGDLPVAAFCSRPSGESDEPIPLWEDEGGSKPDPCKHWRFVRADDKRRLRIEETKFYLLRSKEKIAVPKGIAIYCRASDETIGEMRIHYAGFVHPYFGLLRADGTRGTPLIFEVRGHQVHVSLADGEKLANLIFYRMSQDAPQTEAKEYESQSLRLSKFFGNWPEKLKENDDGTVETAQR
jgi:dCTP deaminase